MAVCRQRASDSFADSYSRLNIEDDLKWQPNRAWTFGIGYFFDRCTYQNGEVDDQREWREGLRQLDPWSWLTGRSSVQYANAVTIIGLRATILQPMPCAVFVQNRDQTKANTIIDAAYKDITISRMAACAGSNILPMPFNAVPHSRTHWVPNMIGDGTLAPICSTPKPRITHYIWIEL